MKNFCDMKELGVLGVNGLFLCEVKGLNLFGVKTVFVSSEVKEVNLYLVSELSLKKGEGAILV